MSGTLDPNGIPAVGGVDDVDQWQPILSAVEGVEAGTKIEALAGVTSATKIYTVMKKQDYTSKSGH